jgi:Zn-dependent protease with chaperone function
MELFSVTSQRAGQFTSIIWCCFVPFFLMLLMVIVGGKINGLKIRWIFLYYMTIWFDLGGAWIRFFFSGLIAAILLSPLLGLIGLLIILTGGTTLENFRTLLPLLFRSPESISEYLQLIPAYATSTLIVVFIAVLFLIPFFAFLGGFGTIIMSILSFFPFVPGGGFLTRLSIGARNIGRHRELPVVKDAMKQILNVQPKIKNVEKFYVVENSIENAYAIGTALYMTRPLIRNPKSLVPLLAHELGHMHNGDARLTMALRRLVIYPVHFIAQSVGQIAPGNLAVAVTSNSPERIFSSLALWLFNVALTLAGGGLGLVLLSPFWIRFWRQRDFEADAFAMSCGQGQELVDYLDQNQYFDVAVPYFFSPYPYVEDRIDAILDLLQAQSQQAHAQSVGQPQPQAGSSQSTSTPQQPVLAQSQGSKTGKLPPLGPTN